VLSLNKSSFAPSISIRDRRLCGAQVSKVQQAGKIFKGKIYRYDGNIEKSLLDPSKGAKDL
jgi:hypothetical protein